MGEHFPNAEESSAADWSRSFDLNALYASRSVRFLFRANEYLHKDLDEREGAGDSDETLRRDISQGYEPDKEILCSWGRRFLRTMIFLERRGFWYNAADALHQFQTSRVVHQLQSATPLGQEAKLRQLQ